METKKDQEQLARDWEAEAGDKYALEVITEEDDENDDSDAHEAGMVPGVGGQGKIYSKFPKNALQKIQARTRWKSAKSFAERLPFLCKVADNVYEKTSVRIDAMKLMAQIGFPADAQKVMPGNSLTITFGNMPAVSMDVQGEITDIKEEEDENRQPN